MVYDRFVQLLDCPAGSAMALVLTLIVLLMIFSGLIARRFGMPGAAAQG